MATRTDSATIATLAFPALAGSIPPLQSGDRLSREEFNRRWEATPQINHAELIFGVVYVQAPISSWHGDPHGQIIACLILYAAATPGTIGAGNASALLGADSQPEPDAHLRIAPSHGGQSRLTSGGYFEGAPEFVAEIAASSASYDLHDKRELYRQHGVREYLVWRIYDNELDWFVLRDGAYEQLMPGADGVLRSECFPGLWLDRAALLAGKLAEVIQLLQAGLSTAEHAEFTARLSRAAQTP
jgi:Uma2 family endonuclease